MATKELSTFAILGATGNVGSSLMRILTQSSSNTHRIRAMVRSKQKLLSQQPNLSSNPNVKIYEGSNSDIATLSECIRGTDAVFLCIAGSENKPGLSIAEDTARMAVSALQKIRDDNPDENLPLLVMLSSAAINEQLCHDIPWIAHQILLTAGSYVYADLRRAEAFLRSKEVVDDLGATSVFMKPGGLVHDVQGGHELSLTESQTFLSFLDLAAGMVEVAETNGQGKWVGKDVSVLPKTKARIEWGVGWYTVKGLFGHFFPGTYLWLTGAS